MSEGWPLVVGVVEFPNGIRVRGRALRDPRPPGPIPELGVYLRSRRPPPEAWPMVWIRWPDFRLPADPSGAVGKLVDAIDLARDRRVEVACSGGRGRTGTALAVMAIAAGIDAGQAVRWVRKHYDPRAVETPRQRRWVSQLEIET